MTSEFVSLYTAQQCVDSGHVLHTRTEWLKPSLLRDQVSSILPTLSSHETLSVATLDTEQHTHGSAYRATARTLEENLLSVLQVPSGEYTNVAGRTSGW